MSTGTATVPAPTGMILSVRGPEKAGLLYCPCQAAPVSRPFGLTVPWRVAESVVMFVAGKVTTDPVAGGGAGGGGGGGGGGSQHGAGGGELTPTVVLPVPVPVSLLQVRPNVVAELIGPTTSDETEPLGPAHGPPDAQQLHAFSVVHCKVVVSPAATVCGEAQMETRGSGHTSSGAGSEIELGQVCSGSGIAPAGPPEAPKLPAKAAIISAMNVFFATRRNMRYSLSSSTTPPTLARHP